MSNDNMSLWESVQETNPDATKKVEYGKRKFTTIDAYAQIQRATELWGPMGCHWGIREESFFVMDGVLFYTALLYINYPDGDSFNIVVPVHSSIKISKDDCAKKVATDALTKGLSKLGFNSDVFLGRFDDNKYVQEMKKKFTPKPEPLLKDNEKLKAELTKLIQGDKKMSADKLGKAKMAFAQEYAITEATTEAEARAAMEKYKKAITEHKKVVERVVEETGGEVVS